MNNFNRKANEVLSLYGVSSKYPKHIWYIQGDMGRKVTCSSRGCHLGDFVNSYSKSAEELPLWRYILSFVGCFVMLLLTVVILKEQVLVVLVNSSLHKSNASSEALFKIECKSQN